MIKIQDPVMRKDIRSGIASVGEVANYLMRNYPIGEIVGALAQYIIDDDGKIAISKTQFDQHFKIIGIRADGEEETRGRKREP